MEFSHSISPDHAVLSQTGKTRKNNVLGLAWHFLVTSRVTLRPGPMAIIGQILDTPTLSYLAHGRQTGCASPDATAAQKKRGANIRSSLGVVAWLDMIPASSRPLLPCCHQAMMSTGFDPSPSFHSHPVLDRRSQSISTTVHSPHRSNQVLILSPP